MLLDNFDSFTYNLVDYFEQLGAPCHVVRNNEPLKDFMDRDYDGIVLSPGPGVPANSGVLMETIDHYYKRLPMLGICLGHHALGTYFGGKLIKAQKPLHGKVRKITLQKDVLFNDLPATINVVQYNSLILEKPPSFLEVIALSGQGEIMGLRHQSLPIWGMQFHPEAALTEHGLKILKNWLVYNNITV
ncbi:MAG: aminodeoxychorismate/anthranilate synthase component II [Fulvivirga sp.]|nr:aminodeoxychorismate/anthranilate synthase component II [Fulvivirga sp.]